MVDEMGRESTLRIILRYESYQALNFQRRMFCDQVEVRVGMQKNKLLFSGNGGDEYISMRHGDAFSSQLKCQFRGMVRTSVLRNL